MRESDDTLAKVLHFDALDAAETITGQRVENGASAFGLGLGLIHAKARLKEQMLRDRDDVWGGCPLEAYIACIEANGYVRCIEEEFAGHYEDERLFVYAHPDGLLLKFDTYSGKRVNGGSVYYNWRPREGADYWELISSGSFAEPDFKVWTGDHDAREALIFNIGRLRENGDLVAPWVKRPFVWLLHYMDTEVEGYDSDAINADRISRLPEWVQEFIGGEHD